MPITARSPLRPLGTLIAATAAIASAALTLTGNIEAAASIALGAGLPALVLYAAGCVSARRSVALETGHLVITSETTSRPIPVADIAALAAEFRVRYRTRCWYLIVSDHTGTTIAEIDTRGFSPQRLADEVVFPLTRGGVTADPSLVIWANRPGPTRWSPPVQAPS